MGRRERQDGAGTLHHIYNRGIARRTIFETRDDKRYFLALLAQSVRRREIRVFSFCLMTTHFHLLLESVDGQLGVAMQRIQTAYSRRFNRSRRRDGPLMRGRYASKRIKDDRYRDAVVAYIAQNPIEAGLSQIPSEYEFCSSHPMWAERRWMTWPFGAAPPSLCQTFLEVVAARLNGPDREDPLGELGSQTPPAVLAWMNRKAQLADASSVGMPVCHATHVMAALDVTKLKPAAGETRVAFERGQRSLFAGLLRDLCGARIRDIAVLVDRSPGAVSTLIADHRKRLVGDEGYAKLAAAIGSVAIGHGPFSASEGGMSNQEFGGDFPAARKASVRGLRAKES